MLTVTKIFEFDAAHYLPNYIGKCSKTHGHRWKLEVEVEGGVTDYGPNVGMIIDFSDLKKIVGENIIDLYDHSLLNNHFLNPTAEIMTTVIMGRLLMLLPKDVRLRRVRLWETPTSYAEWTNENF